MAHYGTGQNTISLALGMQEMVGTLEVGKHCDLSIWDIERPADLVGRIGFNPLHQRIWMGQ